MDISRLDHDSYISSNGNKSENGCFSNSSHQISLPNTLLLNVEADLSSSFDSNSLNKNQRHQMKQVLDVDTNHELQGSGVMLQNSNSHVPDHLKLINLLHGHDKAVNNNTSDGALNIKSEISEGTRYINRVVDELVATEESYVKDVDVVVKGYMKVFDRITSRKVSKEDCSMLFGNIQEIFLFNRNFVEILRANRHSPVEVAKCFVNQAEGFMIYSEYCTNYPKSVKVWTDICMDKTIVARLEQQQIALGHSLPLSAYLFKPVQRILKYHLLLQNIATNHDADAAGHDVVVTAFNCMVEIARHINEMKRHNERLLRTHELQTALASNLSKDIKLLSFGDLILEDEFRVSGASSERLVILFSRALLLAKKAKDGSLITKAIIRMSNLSLVENVAREPCQFSVAPFHDFKQTVNLQAKSVDQKQIWCQEIKKLMIENHPSAIPERARQVLGLQSNPDPARQRSGSLQIVLESRQRFYEAPKTLSEKQRSRKKPQDLLSSDAALELPREDEKMGTEHLENESKTFVRKRSTSHSSLFDVVLSEQTDTKTVPQQISAQTNGPRRSISLDNLQSGNNTELISENSSSLDDGESRGNPSSVYSDVTDGNTAETIGGQRVRRSDERRKSIKKDQSDCYSNGQTIRNTVMALEQRCISSKGDLVKRRGALRREKRDSPETENSSKSFTCLDVSMSSSSLRGSKDTAANTQTTASASLSKESLPTVNLLEKNRVIDPVALHSEKNRSDGNCVSKVQNNHHNAPVTTEDSFVNVNCTLMTKEADGVEIEEDGGTVGEMNSNSDNLHQGWAPPNHVFQLARAFSYRAKKSNTRPRKLAKQDKVIASQFISQLKVPDLVGEQKIALTNSKDIEVDSRSISVIEPTCTPSFENASQPNDGVVKHVHDNGSQSNDGVVKHVRDTVKLINMNTASKRSFDHIVFASEPTNSELTRTSYGYRSGSVQLETVASRRLLTSRSASVGRRARIPGTLILQRMKVFETS